MEMLYFILGMFTMAFIIPLLDSFLTFICGWFEVKRTQQSKKISMIQIEVQKEMDKLDQGGSQNMIGFVVDDEIYEEEDDDDE